MLKTLKTFIVSAVVLTLFSCSTMIKGVTESLVGGVMQQKDMRLIEDGAPAYLLIIESLIFNNPENRDFLEVPTEQGTLDGDVLEQGGTWQGVCSDLTENRAGVPGAGMRPTQSSGTLDELWLVWRQEEGCAQ